MRENPNLLYPKSFYDQKKVTVSQLLNKRWAIKLDYLWHLGVTGKLTPILDGNLGMFIKKSLNESFLVFPQEGDDPYQIEKYYEIPLDAYYPESFIRDFEDTFHNKNELLKSSPITSRNFSIDNLFVNKPKQKDDWFEAIEQAAIDYIHEFSELPSFARLWGFMYERPPKEFGILSCRDKGNEEALLMGGKYLSKSAMRKRYSRWTKKS